MSFKPSYEKYTTVDAIKTAQINTIATHIDTLLSTPYKNIVWNGNSTAVSPQIFINVYHANPKTLANTPCVACWYPSNTPDVCCANILLAIKDIFAPLNPTFEKDSMLIIPFPTKEILDAFFITQSKTKTEQNLKEYIHSDEFDCTGVGLSELPNTLKNYSFTKLYCNLNSLTTFPELPQTITYILANDNQLTGMGTLPPNLERLLCDNNKLTYLPPLPPTLTILSCENNLLTRLPELPESLCELNCYGNDKLECLPDLPKGLKKLQWMSPLLKNRYPKLHWLETMQEKIDYVNKINSFYNLMWGCYETGP